MEIIKPKDHEHWLSLRLDDVTSTEASALFGMNPYQTHYELWHRKKNKEIVKFEENERMKWGNRLESAIAHGVAEDQGWNVIPFKEYGRDPVLRAGSSFDFKIAEVVVGTSDNDFADIISNEGILEIKNVDSMQLREKWIIEDGEVIEAPPHIEIQVQHQLMITGLPVAYIAALVGGNTVKLLKRKPQPDIIDKIRKKIENFWWTIENNQPPKPDFIQDAEFIISLYQSAEPGKIMNAQDDEIIEHLVNQYKDASEQEKIFTQMKKATKAQILELIGDHEKVVADTFSISAGVRGPVDIEAHTRAGFRDFRVFKKKPKGDKK
jgi:putative phage-type endonuclease